MFPAIPSGGHAKGAAPKGGARPLPKPAQGGATPFPQAPKPAKKTPPQNDSDEALSAMFPAIPGTKKTETPVQKPAVPTASSSSGSNTGSSSSSAKSAPRTKHTDVGTQEEEKYSGARKACKFAVSALNFEDSTTAVTQILLALRELTGKDYVPQ